MAYTPGIYYPQYQQYPQMQATQSPQYQMQMPQVQTAPQPSTGLNWVQGESGAKSWFVNKGETVMLMDSEDSVFYLKSTDVAGMPLPLRVFEYTERTPNTSQKPQPAQNIPVEQFATKEEYNALVERYNELVTRIDELQKTKAVKPIKQEAKTNE